MADHGVVCMMSRSGNVWDNAAMESCLHREIAPAETERRGATSEAAIPR
jgi:transposase InsO family protein